MSAKGFIIFSPTTEQERLEGATDEGAERRRHSRYRVGVLTKIELDGRETIPAVTFNMSQSGAMFLTAGEFELGDEITVSFISKDNKTEVSRGRVVHRAKAGPEFVWHQKIGVEFIDKGPTFFEKEIGLR